MLTYVYDEVNLRFNISSFFMMKNFNAFHELKTLRSSEYKTCKTQVKTKKN